MKTINTTIELITSSSINIKIPSVDYDVAKLKMLSDSEEIEIDILSKDTLMGVNKVINVKQNNIWEISANFINIYYLFYKEFFFEFKKDGKVIAKTNLFKVEPKGRRNLYGIVNKMVFDFDKLWNVSGTNCELFLENPLATKCSFCWDFELNQRISSVCPYCDNGFSRKFIPISFKARRIRTETNQVTSDKGLNIIETVIYTTFDRNNFLLESIFFDRTTREFFEIKNANTASIGGVRTSTSITAQKVDISDVRVEKLLPLIS